MTDGRSDAARRLRSGDGSLARLVRSRRVHPDRHGALPRLPRDRALDDHAARKADADRSGWGLALRDLSGGGTLPASVIAARIVVGILELALAGLIIVGMTSVS